MFEKCNTQRLIQWMLFTIIVITLTGCASHRRFKDGPPPFDVDVTRIPNAVPKPQPLAKYGNMPSYVVRGKRYHTMKNSLNYVATGTASWYGTAFHKKNTSSGEPYNMLGMTAAHRTLPLPTFLEVTNLNNGKKVIVKVNDRGPFVGDRLIDLSYVAAKKLDMLGHGTTNVRVKAINPYLYGHSLQFAEKKSHTISPTLLDRRSITTVQPLIKQHVESLYLQVGAFKEREHAEKLRKRLLAILTQPINISNDNTLYRVRVGPFKDVATADSISRALEALGIASNKTRTVR